MVPIVITWQIQGQKNPSFKGSAAYALFFFLPFRPPPWEVYGFATGSESSAASDENGLSSFDSSARLGNAACSFFNCFFVLVGAVSKACIAFYASSSSLAAWAIWSALRAASSISFCYLSYAYLRFGLFPAVWTRSLFFLAYSTFWLPNCFFSCGSLKA